MRLKTIAPRALSIGVVGSAVTSVLGTPQIVKIPIEFSYPGTDIAFAATSVSADGRVVAGRTATEDGFAAFYWDRTGNPVIIPTVSHNPQFANRWPSPLLSPNGQMLAMNSDYPYGGDEIWSPHTGLVQQPGDWRATRMLDSGLIVGSAFAGNRYHAATWTGSDAALFPDLSGTTSSRVSGSDATGQRVVGVTYQGIQSRATLWTAHSTVDLGILTGRPDSTAAAISDNGQWVLVQSGWNTGQFNSYLWSEHTGMMQLPEIMHPLGGTGLTGWSVSDNGIVVGTLQHGLFFGPSFIYTPELGTLSVNQYLQLIGADMNNYSVSHITAISADGTTLAGTAYDNTTNARIGVVITIPAPSGAATLIASGLFFAARRCRKLYITHQTPGHQRRSTFNLTRAFAQTPA
jgi:uncharacterized membrane protein